MKASIFWTDKFGHQCEKHEKFESTDAVIGYCTTLLTEPNNASEVSAWGFPYGSDTEPTQLFEHPHPLEQVS